MLAGGGKQSKGGGKEGFRRGKVLLLITKGLGLPKKGGEHGYGLRKKKVS